MDDETHERNADQSSLGEGAKDSNPAATGGDGTAPPPPPSGEATMDDPPEPSGKGSAHEPAGTAAQAADSGELAVEGKKPLKEEGKRKTDVSKMRHTRVESREMLQAVASINQAQIGTFVVNQIGQEYRTDLGAPPATARQILKGDIERIRRTYFQHEGYRAAFNALSQNHLVILQAPVQTGKWAAAVYMASELADGQLELQDLPPDLDLEGKFTSEDLENGYAYLIDGILPSRAEKLRERDWKNLSGHLLETGCYLIICASNEVHLPIELRNGLFFQLSFPAAVSAVELVRKHLDFELEQQGETLPDEAIERCLAEEQVADLLVEAIPPAHAQQLAEQLALYLSGKCTLENALGLYAGYAEEKVRLWFDECGDDLDERAFRIALAVFNEASYLDVEAAARDLALRLKPAPPDKKEPEKESARESAKVLSLFGNPRSTRLKKARASTRISEIVTEYSDHARQEIVYLQEGYYPAALIRLLWTEFGDFRDIFIEWLHDHAGKNKSDIRNRAAASVGLLASIDFENICDKLLYRWTWTIDGDPDLTRKYRAALTTAMFYLVLDNRANTEALGLLRYWTEQVNRPHLMWAAIRCYSAVGLRYPQEAMESWRKIIEQVDEPLRVNYETLSFWGSPMLISMLDAIESLFMSAFEWQERFYSLYEQILEALRTWVKADEEPRSTSRLGIPLFLMLMSIPMPTESENPDIETRPPALLVMFDGKDASVPGLDHLVWLLRKVLYNQKTRPLALFLLRNWFSFVDEDRRYKTPLILILNGFLNAPNLSLRERERLQFYLQRWAEDPNPKKRSAVAGEIISELNFS